MTIEDDMLTITAYWESYRSNVMAKTVPRMQSIECKRAFMAGARSMMALADNICDSSRSEAEINLLMLAVKAEFDTFVKDALRGRE